jgi:hypothetical protein
VLIDNDYMMTMMMRMRMTMMMMMMIIPQGRYSGAHVVVFSEPGLDDQSS